MSVDHRTVFLALFGMLMVAPVGAARAAPGDVKATLDAPCRYPSGMAVSHKHLYVADWRDAKIFEIDRANGTVTRSFGAPTLRPSGLTFRAGMLYVSDDHAGTVQALNLTSGIVEMTFEAPDKSASGLAFVGDELFILARSKIYRVLPDDGTILGYFDAPNRSCRCLAYDGSYLWVSNRTKDELYMLDPDTGQVLSILASPGPHPTGIAWADGHLWNVDFQTRKLYQLAVIDEPMYRLSDSRHARVEYLWALNNYGPGAVKDLTVVIALPRDLPNQRLLSEVAFSSPPAGKATDRWGQQCALFDVASVPSGTKMALTYNVEVDVSAIRYLLRPDLTGTLADVPKRVREQYAIDGTRYRIESPYIQEMARKIVGDETNCYWIARKIYDFIIGSLHYEMIGGWDIPEVVLKRGSGSCSEYTYTFIALCRAAGLPARYQGSVVVRGDDASIDEAFHRWAQVYLPNYGWVPVDANRGDKPSPADQARAFGELSNSFLITTQGGGDSEHLGWSYNSFARYKTDGLCKVETENLGFWEPLEGTPNSEVRTETKAGACTGTTP